MMSISYIYIYEFRSWEPADARGDLGGGGVDPAQLHRLPVGQRVHRVERDVEPGPGLVDRQHVDRAPAVAELPACAALYFGFVISN